MVSDESQRSHLFFVAQVAPLEPNVPHVHFYKQDAPLEQRNKFIPGNNIQRHWLRRCYLILVQYGIS